MADYTLNAKITGDSKSYEKALDNATNATEEFNDESKNTENQIPKTESKLSSLGDKIGSMGSKMQGMGAKLSLAITTPIVLLGKSMVSAASDYDENLNKIDVAFGKNAKIVKEWSDNAIKQFGLSKNEALESASLFGDMATSMGLSQDVASKMSMSLSGLAGDMASFKNIGVDQAMTALNGVFTGETESLKTLGIVMTDANLNAYALEKGIGKTTSQMSQAEKVQLRYNYVLDMTKNAQGDYARTSDGTANSTRTFKGSIDNLNIALGKHLLPLITPIINGMTDIVSKFSNASPAVQKVILGVAGFAAVIGPLLLIMGTLAGSVSKMITLYGTLKNAQVLSKISTVASTVATSAWNAVCGLATFATNALGAAFTFLTSPIGLVILAITAIIAIGYLLIQNWDEVKAFALDTWNNITTIFKKFDSFLSGVFVKDWTESFGIFGNVLNGFFANASNIWNSIKQVFQGVTDFVKGVFTGNWKLAWQGIVDIFGGVFNGIVAIAKAPINLVIGLVNGMVSGVEKGVNFLIKCINKLSFDVPDWVPGIGGEKFGFNLGKVSLGRVPYLLHGTDNWQGGFARMNEGGRGELTYLPNGTQVIPHDISVKYAQEAAKSRNSSTIIDLDGLLDGVMININNSTNVDGTPLMEKAAQYTLRKMGRQYKAVLKTKGA